MLILGHLVIGIFCSFSMHIGEVHPLLCRGPSHSKPTGHCCWHSGGLDLRSGHPLGV
jgi:hypothetical protein